MGESSGSKKDLGVGEMVQQGGACLAAAPSLVDPGCSCLSLDRLSPTHLHVAWARHRLHNQSGGTFSTDPGKSSKVARKGLAIPSRFHNPPPQLLDEQRQPGRSGLP